MSVPLPQQLCIVGLGLIGGSLAKAIHNKHPQIEITAVDMPHVGKRACSEPAISTFFTQDELERAVRQADLAILATPISVIDRLLDEVPSMMKPGAILTDVGSTKRAICHKARRVCNPSICFIGGHPMTGSELSGLENARAELIFGSTYLLCPSEPAADETKRLTQFLESLDTHVLITTPEEHDKTVAFTSHLPQFISIGLSNLVNERQLSTLTGTAFREMTRVSKSPYAMWQEIVATNQLPLTTALNEMIFRLARLRDQIYESGLEDEFESAQRGSPS